MSILKKTKKIQQSGFERQRSAEKETGILQRLRQIKTHVVADCKNTTSANSSAKGHQLDSEKNNVNVIDLGSMFYQHSIRAQELKRRGVSLLRQNEDYIRKL